MAPIVVLQRPRPAGNHVISGTNLTPLPWKSQCWSASWSLSHRDRAAQCWCANRHWVGAGGHLVLPVRAEVTGLSSCHLGLVERTLRAQTQMGHASGASLRTLGLGRMCPHGPLMGDSPQAMGPTFTLATHPSSQHRARNRVGTL